MFNLWRDAAGRCPVFIYFAIHKDTRIKPTTVNISAFFKVTYGLYIVSSKLGDRLNGHISNTVFQITADPPRFAIASHKENLTTAFITESRVFSISVLQQDADLDFLGPWGFQSGKDISKFDNIRYTTGKTGAPIILDKCIAYIECEMENSIDTGTHILFTGKVVDADVLNEEDPLTYTWYRDHIKGKSPEKSPTYISDELAERETSARREKEAEEQERRVETKDTAGEEKPKLYQCHICGYIYDPVQGDPDGGVPPGTAFEDIPDDWYCPVCGVSKKDFSPID